MSGRAPSPPEAWDAWLDPAHDDAEALCGLLTSREGCTAYRVSTAVNNVRSNGPQLLDPAPEETLF